MSPKRRLRGPNVEKSSSTSEDESSRDGTSSVRDSRTKNEPRRRGPSKRPCLNRNAIMARENRQKKKEYVENIENQLFLNRKHNKNLSSLIQRQSFELKRLQTEVVYLRSVLRNSTAITRLLRSVNESLSSGRPEQRRETATILPVPRAVPVNSAPQMTLGNENAVEPSRENVPEDSRNWFRNRGEEESDSEEDYESKNMRNDGSKESSEHNYSMSSVSERNDPSLFAQDSADLLGFDIVEKLNEQIPDFDDRLFDALDDELILGSLKRPEEFRRQEPDETRDKSTKLFDNLNNCGVCLHVNSNRVSLEYCSRCYLNSIKAPE